MSKKKIYRNYKFKLMAISSETRMLETMSRRYAKKTSKCSGLFVWIELWRFWEYRTNPQSNLIEFEKIETAIVTNWTVTPGKGLKAIIDITSKVIRNTPRSRLMLETSRLTLTAIQSSKRVLCSTISCFVNFFPQDGKVTNLANWLGLNAVLSLLIITVMV